MHATKNEGDDDSEMNSKAIFIPVGCSNHIDDSRVKKTSVIIANPTICFVFFAEQIVTATAAEVISINTPVAYRRCSR